MAKLRITYNAPVVLTFALAAVFAFILMNVVDSAKLWFVGRAMIEQLFANYPMRFHGDHKLIATAANGQLAAAGYLRPHGAHEFKLAGVHVLGLAGTEITEITTFGSALCARFGADVRDHDRYRPLQEL